MGIINLGDLDGDQVVIHFGGALKSVDAYTFAKSLVAFADVATAANKVLNPGQDVELRLEANGPGSYRAAVRKRNKGEPGFFSRGAENLLWQTVGLLIISPFFAQTDVNVTVNADEVIIDRGGDRLIVPRIVHDRLASLQSDPDVSRNLQRTFDALEEDEAIENFGLAKNLSDPEPVVQVPRADFHRAGRGPAIEPVRDEARRTIKEKARLVILKAWFKRGTKKWQFFWNEVPISAAVKDDEFWDKMDRHEIVFGTGDGLDVEIEFEQDRDEALGMWVPDTTSYRVVKVIKPISRGGAQTSLH